MQHKRTTKPFSDVQVNEDLNRRKKLGSFLVLWGRQPLADLHWEGI